MAAEHLMAVTDATFELEVEPCRMVTPVLDELAGKYEGKLKVTKVDVDANQKTAMRFNVRSIPSILFFKDGQHVDTVVGAYPKPVFEEKIEKHLS
jgi:thioredoxin 1